MQNDYKKPTWDEYFLNIMDVVGTRGTCDRGRCGCVFTKKNRILATGYVGSPPGEPECDKEGHEMVRVIRSPKPGEDKTNPNYNPDTWMIESDHCVRTIHAEQNAMVFAARNGISLEGSTLYIGMTPCIVCAKMLVSVGIKRVVARKLYQAGQEGLDLFKRKHIKVNILDETVVEYK